MSDYLAAILTQLQSLATQSVYNIQQLNGYRTKLASLYPKLVTLVQDEDSITLALNEEYVPMGEVWKIKDGDTVALIPPISGG
jgi:molybdopterin converting factor small subunit